LNPPSRPSGPGEGHRAELLAFLLGLQRECGGLIPFERYMEEALHHPRFGYYGASIASLGPRGDFSTSATLSERLGSAIAAWALARRAGRGWRRLPLLEVGAGDGRLARAILRRLGWFRRLRTDYLIVERSGVLRARQRRRLRGLGVRWHGSMQEALQALGGRALIFSNEVVDAFPCRLFRKEEAGWRELGVHLSPEGSLREEPLEEPSEAGDPWFAPFGALPPGQRVERHDSYRRWLGSWAPAWREGSLLTIDYGETSPRLYEGRLRGSLRAYWKHRCLSGSDLYARFGRQDLTADVHFDDLGAWGREWGWTEDPLQTQADFLDRWAPLRHGPAGRSDLFLTRIPGAGEAFKVLEQRPSVG
jgi:SAM-dependent MidA family methyltransferase